MPIATEPTESSSNKPSSEVLGSLDVPDSTVHRITVPPSAPHRVGPAERVTLVDRLYQLVYRVAYRVLRLLCAVVRPTTHGALIVVWKRGSILLVRNSYVSYFSPPGGYVRGGETALRAAVRELAEETGLKVQPTQLKLSHEETHEWDFRHDHVTMYDVEVADPVTIDVDHREVVAAGFYTPEEALTLSLFPPLRRRLEKYLSGTPSTVTGTPSTVTG